MTKRLNSFKDLEHFYDQAKDKMAALEAQAQVKVHLGSCGIASGANKVLETFRQAIADRELSGVALLPAACIGLCNIEPTVTVFIPGQEKVIYHDIDETKVSRIVEEHLIGGQPVSEWVLDTNTPRLRLQKIRILSNQDLDPMDINQYI